MANPKILLVSPDGSRLELTDFKVKEGQALAKELPWPLALETPDMEKSGLKPGVHDGSSHILVIDSDKSAFEYLLLKRLRGEPVTTIHTPLTELQRNTLRLFGKELDDTQKVFVSLEPVVGAKAGPEGGIDINVAAVQRQIADARKLVDSPNMAAIIQYFEGPCPGRLMALSAAQSLFHKYQSAELGADKIDLRFLNFMLKKAGQASERRH